MLDGFCSAGVLSPGLIHPATSGSCCLLVTSELGLITLASMTFVIGDITHANLVDFLLSQLSYRAPCADDTNRLQRLRVYLAFSFVQADRNQPAEGNISAIV